MRLLHEDRDFIERNGAWVLSMVAAVGACVSGLCIYVLKSRCRTIKCCGQTCERDVMDLQGTTLEPAPTAV